MSGKVWLILSAFLILNFCIYYVYLIPYISYHQEALTEFSQSNYEQEYYEFIEGLKERASVMNGISIFNKEGGYAKRNIEKTVNDFARVEGISIEPMIDSSMEALHSFYLSDVFMLLIVCLFCFQGCGKDFKSGMTDLTCKNTGSYLFCTADRNDSLWKQYSANRIFCWIWKNIQLCTRNANVPQYVISMHSRNLSSAISDLEISGSYFYGTYNPVFDSMVWRSGNIMGVERNRFGSQLWTMVFLTG